MFIYSSGRKTFINTALIPLPPSVKTILEKDPTSNVPSLCLYCLLIGQKVNIVSRCRLLIGQKDNIVKKHILGS